MNGAKGSCQMIWSRRERDAWVDAEVRRADPARSSLVERLAESSLDEAGHLILQYASRERPLRRRALRPARRLVLIVAAILSVSGAAIAAASGVFVNANTHTYNHGWQHIAGGPGENLNAAGTNWGQVVRRESAGAGIVYPAAYAAWRKYAIKHFRPPVKCPAGSSPGCKVEESTGMINVNIAQSAFCAWVLDWRQAELNGDAAVARQAAAVIAKVPRWKAVTDIKYIKGEYSGDFGWIRPFMRAVAAGDVSKVNALIASNTGSWFWFNDPRGFMVSYSKRINRTPQRSPRKAALVRDEGASYLHYLDQHGAP
jgi:hypothetical protein